MPELTLTAHFISVNSWVSFTDLIVESDLPDNLLLFCLRLKMFLISLLEGCFQAENCCLPSWSRNRSQSKKYSETFF